MNKINVAPKATDAGPVGTLERWHRETHIGSITSDVNDWLVDPQNKNAITNWFSNATIKGKWASANSSYSGITTGNNTAADFTYPKFCNQHMCH